jgi:hypothetical protein
VNQLVLGAGEVGEALATLMGCDLRDVEDPGDLASTYQILHVCIPWQVADFVGTVQAYDAQYSPEFVVVHSTVPVGTCDRHGWIHSPIRGKHPNLLEGIRTFKKHYRGSGAADVARMLESWFPNVVLHEWAATTEAAKLYELVQFGIEVVMEKTIHAYCKRMNLPFDEVYTAFGQSYVEGWLELGHPEYVKPILTHMDGPLGGHCVAPAAKMMKEHCNDILAQVVLAVQKDLEGK